MAIGKNQPPTDPKPLHRSKPNLTQFITFGELLKGQNSSSADQRGLAHEGSTYKVSVSFFFFFFLLFVSWLSALQKRLGRFLRSIRRTTRSRARRCFWESQRFQKFPRGSFSPKTPQNRTPNGDFQLKQKYE